MDLSATSLPLLAVFRGASGAVYAGLSPPHKTSVWDLVTFEWNNSTQGSINMQYSKYGYLFQNTLGILQQYLQYIVQKYENAVLLFNNSGHLNKVDRGLWAGGGTWTLHVLWMNTDLFGEATRIYSHQYALFHDDNHVCSLGGFQKHYTNVYTFLSWVLASYQVK